MKIQTILFSLLSLGCLCAARSSASLTDEWTAAGGAWTAAGQSGFVSGSGGSLSGDTGSSGATALTVANATSGGLFTDYYYSLFSTPTFTLTSSDVLADITTLSVEIHMAGTFTAAPSLTFNGQALTASATSFADGTIGGSFAATTYTYTWDVASVVAESNTFSIDWTLPNHTAIDAISITQSSSAVPEPSAFAAIAGAGALTLVAFRRRRQR
jgi:hypothetical protein